MHKANHENNFFNFLYFLTILFGLLLVVKGENVVGSTSSKSSESSSISFFSIIFQLVILCAILCLISIIYILFIKVDPLIIETKSVTGTEEEKESAENIKALLVRRNWLYITILILLIITMIFIVFYIMKISSERVKTGILVCLGVILFFNGILPEILINKSNILLANKFIYFTKGLMIFTAPISYPISFILSILIGDKYNFKKRLLNFDFKSLIQIHKISQEENANRNSMNSVISSFDLNTLELEDKKKTNLIDEEAHLMISALEIKNKQAIDLLIPIEDAYMLDYDEIIDNVKLKQIKEKGYSRIPIFENHDKNDILGVVRIKQLVGVVNASQRKTLREMGVAVNSPLVVHPNVSLINLLREFRKGKSHMAFITEQVAKLQTKFEEHSLKKNYNDEIQILGIVTLEDVIENILNVEIYDEDDYENMKNMEIYDTTSSIQKFNNSKNNGYCNNLFDNSFDEKNIFNIKDSIKALEGIEESLYRKIRKGTE